MWWDDAATVRGEKARLEIEETEKMVGRIGKRDGNGPGDELRGIGNASGREELNVTVIHYAVDGACRKSIPLWPPATAWMAHCFIRRVLQHKLNMVDAGSIRVDAIMVGSCECSVNTNEVPARSSGAGRQIRNEEEFVLGFGDS